MYPRIKVTSMSFSKNEHLVKELKGKFPYSTFNTLKYNFTKEELTDFIKEADGAIIGLEKIDKEIITNCPNLEIIAKYGVGLDNIDINACRKHNITVAHTQGTNKLSVAEKTLCFMLALTNNVFQSSYNLKNNNWEKKGGFQLSEKTVGVIGVGNIGKEVIRLLKPFNCNILVNDIIDQSDYYKKNNLEESTKEEIFRNANIITIHTPLTKETRYMINNETISLMKKSAFIINTARGSILNQNDLKNALKNSIIAGAAIDVYEEEPPQDKEFIALPNLITTPHIGGNSYEAIIATGMSAIEHLTTFFNKK